MGPLNEATAAIEDQALRALFPAQPRVRTDAMTGVLEAVGALVPLVALIRRGQAGRHLVLATSEGGAATALAVEIRGQA